MQGLGRCFAVRHQSETDVTGAGIAAIELGPSQIAAGDDAPAPVPKKFHGCPPVAAALRDTQPDAEAAGGPPIAIAIAEDLVGEIEFDPIQPPIFLDMRFIAV